MRRNTIIRRKTIRTTRTKTHKNNHNKTKEGLQSEHWNEQTNTQHEKDIKTKEY